MRRVGVVIPYYQRERGLLRRALDSVTAQEIPSDVRVTIVVVDDESPLAVDGELSGFVLPAWCELMVLRQPNAGPGAARNLGLSKLDPSETTYVAFLDSDDLWHSNHLRAAFDPLRDSDFYFTNVSEENADLFSYSNYVRQHHRREASGAYSPLVRTLTSAEAVEALLSSCFVSTSQVVYDFRKHSNLRFAVDQGRAGEDYLFWLNLSSRCERVTYSTVPMGRRGWGVSIYRESLSWDSLYALDSLIDGLKVQKRLVGFATSSSVRRMLRKKRRRMRDRLTVMILRELWRRPRVAGRALSRLARQLPEYFLLAPGSLVRARSHVKSLRAEPPN